MTWAPDYVTLTDQKLFARIADTVDDAEIAVAITAASRAIDHHCNRQFGAVAAAEERLYTARPDYERHIWVVDVDDFMAVTGLAVEITDVGTVTDYVKEPVNAAQKGMPWTRIAISRDSSVQPTGEAHEVAVTVLWGWSAIPVPVEQATYLQTSRFLSRRDSPYGIAGSPDQGSEMRLLARVDPDVAVSLRGLVRPRRAG